MTDEEYVRANWLVVEESEYDPHEVYTIPHTRVNFGKHWRTEIKANDAWAAAAEFTRERLEQIRQLERDIDFMRQFESSAEEWLEHLDRQRDADENAADARSACPTVRIIARLESALADLKRGMRTAGDLEAIGSVANAGKVDHATDTAKN